MSSLGITHYLMTENWLGLWLAGQNTRVWRSSRSLMELEPGEERSEVREVLSQLSGRGGRARTYARKRSPVSKKSHLHVRGFNCRVDVEHRYKKVVVEGVGI